MSEENTTPNSEQNLETNSPETASQDLTKDLEQMNLRRNFNDDFVFFFVDAPTRDISITIIKLCNLR